MLVLLHVTIALSSLVYSSFLLISPRKSGFAPAYGLVALTLMSGTALVASLQTHILRTCVTGLAYLAFVATCLAIARFRLAKQVARDRQD